MEVSGQLHDPAALAPGKGPQVPTGLEAGVGPRAGSVAVEQSNSLPPAGNRTPAVQPVTHRYTD
jgi:hypothetical protein